MQPHMITKVRREPRRRVVQVSSVERLTPRMLRIAFASDDLRDFESAAPDDHVKLFIPDRAQSAGEPHKRDFTPRAFDPASGSLSIDFAVHESGPAIEWANTARVGDTLEIGGPRGSTVVPDDFDWYLMIGDETALPAIGRWVERLRRGVPVTTFCLVADAGEIQTFETEAEHKAIWLDRSRQPSGRDTAMLDAALAQWQPSAGDGYIWIAAEASVARSLRDYFLNVHQHPRAWIKAAGYWKSGTANAHEKIED